MTSAAIGSAHHQPKVAFNNSPPRRIAERSVQSAVCVASAASALFPIAADNTPLRTDERHDDKGE